MSESIQLNIEHPWIPLDQLVRVIDVIKRSAASHCFKEAKDPDLKKWFWYKNSKCKYIDLRIDMRDGAFTLRDREGDLISIEQLEQQ